MVQQSDLMSAQILCGNKISLPPCIITNLKFKEHLLYLTFLLVINSSKNATLVTWPCFGPQLCNFHPGQTILPVCKVYSHNNRMIQLVGGIASKDLHVFTKGSSGLFWESIWSPNPVAQMTSTVNPPIKLEKMHISSKLA